MVNLTRRAPHVARRRMRVAAVLTAIANLAAALIPGSATPAFAVTTPEYNYSFTTATSSALHSVPGSQVTVALAAGQKLYLYTKDLFNTLLTPMGADDAPGTTFYLSCWKAGESTTDRVGVYSAQNTVTPNETTIDGTMRWLLVAPSAGSYTCEIQVGSYARADSIIEAGGRIYMRVKAGAQLNYSHVGQPGSTVRSAHSWAMPDVESLGEEFVLWSGVKQLNGSTIPLTSGAGNLTIVQDVNLTTCIPGDHLKWSDCAGGDGGSTMRTWIEAQPQYSDGRACGPLIKGTVKSTWISRPRHHKTVNDTLTISRSGIGAACTQVRTTLKVEHGGGAQTVIHYKWHGPTKGNRPTHGVAYQF
ncbi:hypothetical protein Nm8I071_23270 [Nonomuraea sp. TT08I-71]|nr:hypothetical protein Nm8I071_23270 [Nonomuraea sp. TT08I-71]